MPRLERKISLHIQTMFDYYKTQDYTKPGQYFALRYDTFVNKCVVLGLTPSEDIAI